MNGPDKEYVMSGVCREKLWTERDVDQMTLTDWIDGSIKPTVDGVYQRRFPDGGIAFCRFFRGFWCFCASTIEEAAQSIIISGYDLIPWRGLKEKP
jgi:hypothetical protein